MKHIHITLEDFEYKQLIEVKQGMTWHDYLCKEIINDDK